MAHFYTPSTSTLLYGGPGAGKTSLAVSSFWDWQKQEKICNGKLITFGAEDNPALAIPEECRHTDKGTPLRLTSPLLDDREFLNQFNLITRRFVQDAIEGNPLDVLVIDGMSEFDLLFEETFEDDDNNFAKWNALLSQMFACMMRATHSALQAHVIMTARVMERKKAKQQGRVTMAGDPAYLDYDFYPAMRGAFRQHMPHYFNMVLYMETDTGVRDGKPIPIHVANMVRTGDYYVKNVWEHAWLAKEPSPKVANPMWYDLWTRQMAANDAWLADQKAKVTQD